MMPVYTAPKLAISWHGKQWWTLDKPKEEQGHKRQEFCFGLLLFHPGSVLLYPKKCRSQAKTARTMVLKCGEARVSSIVSQLSDPAKQNCRNKWWPLMTWTPWALNNFSSVSDGLGCSRRGTWATWATSRGTSLGGSSGSNFGVWNECMIQIFPYNVGPPRYPKIAKLVDNYNDNN